MTDRMTHLAAARQAAEEAGQLLLSYYGSLEPWEVEEKGRNDVVSKADRESEDLCRQILLGAFPKDSFLGEESGASSADWGEAVWIVDPLDGTANFVRGFPHWCVSIARVEESPDGPIHTAVIWDPVKEDLFWAVRGKGAFRNGRRIHVPPRSGLPGAALATGFPFRQHRKIDTYLKVFKAVFLSVQSLRRAGSAALDLAYTATGIFDGFFEFGLSRWDTAAGALIVTEAGGMVSDFSGGDKWRERGNLVAASPGVHTALLELVAKEGIAEQAL
jgi:myo-inositol-1(or 4)-monophosphatase